MAVQANPMGMLWMMLAGQADHSLGTTRWAHERLAQGLPMDRTNKFTLLDDAMPVFGGAATAGWVSQADSREQLLGSRQPGGERRRLFGVGEGPAEAVAGVKQESMGVMRKRFDRVLVTEAWLLNGSTQAGVRNKMRNNDLRFGYGHASVALRSPS